MKGICKGLGVTILVLGLIGSFILGIDEGFVWFIVGFLPAIILPVILIAISEILGKLKDIDDKLANMEATVNGNKEKQVQNPGELWWCSKCGRMNASTKESCDCGQSRD